MDRPIIKSTFSTQELQQACEEYLDHLFEVKYSAYSRTHIVFEKAMEMLYGKNVWDFVMDNVLDGIHNENTYISE